MLVFLLGFLVFNALLIMMDLHFNLLIPQGIYSVHTEGEVHG